MTAIVAWLEKSGFERYARLFRENESGHRVASHTEPEQLEAVVQTAEPLVAE